MKKKVKKQYKFGLIGKDIDYSFSRKYFTEKFNFEHFDNCEYLNFDIKSIEQFSEVITTKGLKGLNVTVPYKEQIIPKIDKLSKKAALIGAVNTIRVKKNNKTIGYNTDWYGFKKSIKPLLKKRHTKALILGTGGASKAVAYALKTLKIEYDFVSRNANEYQFNYSELNKQIFDEYLIIINTTPLGTFPNIEEKPILDYSLFTSKHIAFDLVYNPEESAFLAAAKAQGATVKNGYELLKLQAEKAWKIWNK